LTRTRRSTPALAALVLVVVALLVLAPGAMADAFTPESSDSPNAAGIDTLYKIVFGLGLLVFLGVEGVLVYSLIKFRWRRRSPEPAQIRGNTRLEIGWTLGAAGLLVVITAITFVFLGDIKNPATSGRDGLQIGSGGASFANVGQPAPPGGRALRIKVNGQQYLWRFEYPGKPRELFTYHTLVVPVNTTVTMEITSQDVQHSWWIPKLGGKADAVPGHTNETWFKVSKPGLYVGECAELCGEGHASHRAIVKAVPVDRFESWATQQRADIKEAQQQLAITRRERENPTETPEANVDETAPEAGEPEPNHEIAPPESAE